MFSLVVPELQLWRLGRKEISHSFQSQVAIAMCTSCLHENNFIDLETLIFALQGQNIITRGKAPGTEIERILRPAKSDNNILFHIPDVIPVILDLDREQIELNT